MHEFSIADGENPRGDLFSFNGMLYGMTQSGGGSASGVIFRINPDGTGYQLLHEFAGGADDGGGPIGTLSTDGSVLYGAAFDGGDSNEGVVFRMNPDGTGFELLHEFAGGGDDGVSPVGNLLVSGSTLYGMTYSGGDTNVGTVFKVNTDGTGFQLLHEFAGGAIDGSTPWGSLILSGSVLYGMTLQGGNSDSGVVFKLNTDGTGFQLLHGFTGGVDDGASPYGNLLLSDSALYGVTYNGGDANVGTVFKVNTDGTGFQLLHEFAGGADDGGSPRGSLLLSGSALYGMTYNGGDFNKGVVFKLNTDGTGFQLLHGFAGGNNDGANPMGGLTLVGSSFYGMTWLAGNTNSGVVFRLDYAVPVPPTATTGGAGGETATGATLNGTVNGGNDSTTVTFEYGLTDAYGSVATATQSPVIGGADTAVSTAIAGLAPATTYHFRVAGQNTIGIAHGDDATFMTLDGTGVSPEVQDAAPNGGDGNGDSIPDKGQTNVASLPSAVDPGMYLTVEASIGCALQGVHAYLPGAGEDPSYTYPYGMVAFQSSCSPVTVRIYYHGAGDMSGYVFRKYGPTPADWATPVWYDFPVNRGTEEIGGETVPYIEFTLTEGQLGDSTDGLPIVDPIGPALAIGAPVQTIPSLNAWGIAALAILLMLGGLAVTRRKKAA